MRCDVQNSTGCKGTRAENSTTVARISHFPTGSSLYTKTASLSNYEAEMGGTGWDFPLLHFAQIAGIVQNLLLLFQGLRSFDVIFLHATKHEFHYLHHRGSIFWKLF